eukprot:577020-Amorphochlora_amoeboformis.AAC.1
MPRDTLHTPHSADSTPAPVSHVQPPNEMNKKPLTLKQDEHKSQFQSTIPPCFANLQVIVLNAIGIPTIEKDTPSRTPTANNPNRPDTTRRRSRGYVSYSTVNNGK